MNQKDLNENISIGAVKPVNRTAANALKGGYTHNPDIDEAYLQRMGDTKIKPEYRTHPFSGSEFAAFKELLGKKYGELTVLGLSHERAKRWVVRCACGTYTFRAAKAIRNGIRNGFADSCETCRMTHTRQQICYDSKELLPYRTLPQSEGIDEKKALLELIGKHFGTFTVLGVSTQRSSRWVVKCDCGMYSLRTAKQIRHGQESTCRACAIRNFSQEP